MVRDELTLRYATNAAAIALAAGAMLLLTMALAIEIARRRNSASRVVVVADRILPMPARRRAVALLALLSTAGAFVGPQAASADTSVRRWLNDPVPTTSVPTPQESPRHSAPRGAHDPGIAQPSRSSAGEISTAPPPTTTPGPPDGPPSAALPPDPHPALVVHATPNALAPKAPTPAVASPLPARPGRASGPARSGTSATTLPTPSAVAPPTPSVSGARSTVVAGDCLWSIAARLLGPGATNRAIDRGWRQIYEANRASIGENPSLIHPGLTLTLPHLDHTP